MHVRAADGQEGAKDSGTPEFQAARQLVFRRGSGQGQLGLLAAGKVDAGDSDAGRISHADALLLYLAGRTAPRRPH